MVRGGGVGRRLTRDYDIRMQEEQVARVCEREREGNTTRQKEPREIEQGGGEEKGIGRPAETKEDRTRVKTAPRSQNWPQHLQLV